MTYTIPYDSTDFITRARGSDQRRHYAVRLLDALGSKSIPLTTIFPARDEAGAAACAARCGISARTLEQALSETYEK